MGFTGLARWVNAPPTGLSLVRDNLLLNHNAAYRGKWHIVLKSYRSTIGQSVPFERTMYTITMDENVFVNLEDPAAPTRMDVLSAAPPGQEISWLQNPSHYRSTFLTVRPPGSLEQLLTQIKAKWVPVRQTSSGNSNNPRSQPLSTAQQLTVDGHIFGIGTDWIVRIGNVVLAGGAVRGMLLEAEYLPLPVLKTPLADGTSDLLSNLLASILPLVKDAKTVAVTISDAQWEDVLWDREEEIKSRTETKSEAQDDDPYSWDNDDVKDWKPNDWIGIDRDQRSAYLIMGALRSESLL
ncbi:hypothetical protein CPB83DRAFT_327558 [Crepidotus variabilis]|uniref:Mediator of RNA polymerase II transcription subunit 20 n=1 Tax=Crepidotus variabilis TaxID=179855 RepID=A0A9P6ESN7_9AGAR|nr:hypothetical protein CPB83DRAFT_327558 [Crepidotus variabilis]